MPSNKRNLLASSGISAEVLPEAVSFAADTDYLTTGVMTGAADGKTFTLSLWIYLDGPDFTYPLNIGTSGTATGMVLFASQNGYLQIQARNAATTVVLQCIPSNGTLPLFTWTNILISCDMTDTGKRHYYVNDADLAPTWSPYSNDTINFEHTGGTDVNTQNGSGGGPCRLAHLFLDYTYRDLSIVSNRRNFITEDLKPAEIPLPAPIYVSEGVTGDNPIYLADDTTGTKFDGTNDWLELAANLTSDSDSKTLTMSFWVWVDGFPSTQYIYANQNGRFFAYLTTGKDLQILGSNASATQILNVTIPLDAIEGEGWANVVVSIDMANTSNRYIYLDGVAATPTWSVYTNDTLDLDNARHGIAASATGTSKLNGRLAHFFFDHTYRDLSDSAELAKFYASAGLPATGQAALSPIMYFPLIDDFTNDGTGGAFTTNGSPLQGQTDSPILYLPMTDAATAGANAGTGGDFTINGDPQTASRGPNQDNCVASEFDGTADYLLNSSFPSISSKEMTCSFNINPDNDSTTLRVFQVVNSGSSGAYYVTLTGSVIQVDMWTGGAAKMTVSLPRSYMGVGANHTVSVSVDLTSTSNRYFFLDGVDVTADVTWSVYLDATIAITGYRAAVGRLVTASGYFDGDIGEVWVDDAYTDLSTSNPFWNSDTNRPNSVRKVIEDTGVTPLIALPIIGNDAGTNLGSGGDFTVNSGPYTGARGGSEFWARSAWTGITNSATPESNYLRIAGGVGGSATTTTITAVMAVKSRDTTLGYNNLIWVGPYPGDFAIRTDTGERVEVTMNTGIIMRVESAISQVKATDWTLVAFSWNGGVPDLVTKVQGVAKDSATGTSYATSVDLSGECFLLSGDNASLDFPGDVGMYYVVDSYLDMTDPDIWNIFFDRLDNPRDLTDAIADGDIPEPLVYMKFDDPDALGTNSGTGGDFTINGTIQSGADVGVV